MCYVTNKNEARVKMSCKHFLLADYNFLLIRFSGELDNFIFKQYVSELDTIGREIPNSRKLVDCRFIESFSNLSLTGIIESSLLETKRSDSRLAILVPESSPALYGMARTYCVYAHDKRESTEIFKDYNMALTWLAENEEEKNVFDSFVADQE